MHARALQDDAYDVHLIDPVQRHVIAAQAAGLNSALGDARDLSVDSGTFDIALLLDPLYHLSSASDRRVALTEVTRVLKPGGVLFAAGLSHNIAFASVSLG